MNVRRERLEGEGENVKKRFKRVSREVRIFDDKMKVYGDRVSSDD
jgi:hypothetical protein